MLQRASPPLLIRQCLARSRIPQAELVVLPQAAHIPAVEQAERVNRHLAAFLDGLTGARASRSGGVSFEAGLCRRPGRLVSISGPVALGHPAAIECEVSGPLDAHAMCASIRPSG